MATGGGSPSKGEEEGQWTLNNLEISKKQRNKERWTDQDPMSAEDFLLRSENEYEERQMHDLISDSDESVDLSHYKSNALRHGSELERVKNVEEDVDLDQLQSSLARIKKCVHSMQQHDTGVETRRLKNQLLQERHNDRQVNSSREPRRKRGADARSLADVDRQMLQLQNTLRHLEGIVTAAPKKRDNVFRELGARRHYEAEGRPDDLPLHTKFRKLAEAERLVQLLNNLMASIRSGDEEVLGNDEPHNLEVQELFSQPNHRGERNTQQTSKNLNSKLNIQNAVGRRPKDNVRRTQDINEFCPPLENSLDRSKKPPCQLSGSPLAQQLRRQMEQLSALCTAAPHSYAVSAPPPSASEKEDLLLCLSQCYHTIYMQQMEIHHLRTTHCTHEGGEGEWWSKPSQQPIRAVIHPACQRRTQEETLNNQVRQPAARANNFLDNFRSYSRQNLLQGEGGRRIRHVQPMPPPDRSWPPPEQPRHKRANATGVSATPPTQDTLRNGGSVGDDFFVGLYRAARSLKGAEQRHRAIHMLKEMASSPEVEGAEGGRAESALPWMNQLPTAAIPPLSKGGPSRRNRPYYEHQAWDQPTEVVSAVLLDVQGCCPAGSSPAFWSSLCAYVVSRARAHSAPHPRALNALRAQLTAHVLPAFGGHKYADCEAEFLKLISDLLYDTLADYGEEKDDFVDDDKTRELSLSMPPQDDVFLQPPTQEEWGADLAEADQSPSHPEQEDGSAVGPEQEDEPQQQEEDPLPLEAAASNQENEKQKD